MNKWSKVRINRDIIRSDNKKKSSKAGENSMDIKESKLALKSECI
jgi:hypothetical protein